QLQLASGQHRTDFGSPQNRYVAITHNWSSGARTSVRSNARTANDLAHCCGVKSALRAVLLLKMRIGFLFPLPEVCNVAKVLRHPLVAIDGVEVAFSAVMKNDYARRAPAYPLLHLFYC